MHLKVSFDIFRTWNNLISETEQEKDEVTKESVELCLNTGVGDGIYWDENLPLTQSYVNEVRIDNDWHKSAMLLNL